MYPTDPRRCLSRLPWTETLPDVGLSRPAMMFRRVLLPHPDGPIMDTNSPSSMWKLTSLRTGSGLESRSISLERRWTSIA